MSGHAILADLEKLEMQLGAAEQALLTAEVEFGKLEAEYKNKVEQTKLSAKAMNPKLTPTELQAQAVTTHHDLRLQVVALEATYHSQKNQYDLLNRFYSGAQSKLSYETALIRSGAAQGNQYQP